MHICVAKFLLISVSIMAFISCTSWYDPEKTNKIQKEVVDVVEVLLDQDPD